METQIFRLHLVFPIYYIHENEPEPFIRRAEGNSGNAEDARNKEKIFCFELDESQYLNIEPDREKLLGTLLSGGEARLSGGKAFSGEAGQKQGEIPQGNYLFAQKRELLNRDEIIALAVEIQQEGLWQRLTPGKALYLRYLYEDGSDVTQLYRPFTL